MKWRKIYKDERLPEDDIIYTDGIHTTLMGLDVRGVKRFIGDNISIDQATHYMLLREIPKPWNKLLK